MGEEYTCSRPKHSCGKKMRRGAYTEECYELKQCPQCYTKELMMRVYEEQGESRTV